MRKEQDQIKDWRSGQRPSLAGDRQALARQAREKAIAG